MMDVTVEIGPIVLVIQMWGVADVPSREDVDVSLRGLTVVDATGGTSRDVGDLRGVHVMVLMRHRH